MEWQDEGVSSDIEDRRGSSGGGGGFGFGGGMGIGGVILLLILSVITGRNFFAGTSDSASPQPDAMTGPVTSSPDEERDVHLISFVLDDAQKTWEQIFTTHGRQYRHAKLVLYRDITNSGCGAAQASTGPFYCPEDEKIYIDLGFWQDLKRFGGDTGDFAQAYVVTHELGHHIQKLLGIEQRMQTLSDQNQSEQNPLSVDLELQADCFSGVWGHSTEQRNIVHPEDIDGALKAAAAVGDDHLQKMSGRAVIPESWTHGSSAERQQWFKRGLDGGEVESCPTFNGKLTP